MATPTDAQTELSDRLSAHARQLFASWDSCADAGATEQGVMWSVRRGRGEGRGFTVLYSGAAIFGGGAVRSWA